MNSQIAALFLLYLTFIAFIMTGTAILIISIASLRAYFMDKPKTFYTYRRFCATLFGTGITLRLLFLSPTEQLVYGNLGQGVFFCLILF